LLSPFNNSSMWEPYRVHTLIKTTNARKDG